MLSQSLRTAILELHRKAVGTRRISRTLQVSRMAVKKVIRSRSTVRPASTRGEKARPRRQDSLGLYASCQGHLVGVDEQLLGAGRNLFYPGLTAWCRRKGLGQERRRRVGQ